MTNLAAPQTPAELLCCLAALLPLMAGATWLVVQMSRQARVERRTQAQDEDERRRRREDER